MRADMQIADQCERVFTTAEDKLRQLVTAHPDYLPQYTRGGKWKHDGAPWTNWCQGFLPGQLWLLYLYSGDAFWRGKAERYCELIEARKDDRETHDLGFLFWHSWKRWHDLDGGARQRDVVIRAGQTMGLRYKEKGGYLSSFVAPESAFIDIMMNVGIMFYAARETDDAALTTARCRIASPAGAIWCAAMAAPCTKASSIWRRAPSCARARTRAGVMIPPGRAACPGRSTASPPPTPSRSDPRFLQTACHCADYYILNTPAHGICPNDWREPNPARPFEASAAAITSSGLQDLADLVGDPLRARSYRDYACRIIGEPGRASFPRQRR